MPLGPWWPPEQEGGEVFPAGPEDPFHISLAKQDKDWPDQPGSTPSKARAALSTRIQVVFILFCQRREKAAGCGEQRTICLCLPGSAWAVPVVGLVREAGIMALASDQTRTFQGSSRDFTRVNSSALDNSTRHFCSFNPPV